MPNVTVKVTVIQPTANDPFSIAVDPFVLDLGQFHGGAVKIEWELDNNQATDWDFATPSPTSPAGIEIKGHYGKFDHDGKNARKYGWTRKQNMNDNQRYQYSINVVRSDGVTATLDPFVVNR